MDDMSYRRGRLPAAKPGGQTGLTEFDAILQKSKPLSLRPLHPMHSYRIAANGHDPQWRGSVMARPSRRTARLLGVGAAAACVAASAAVVWQASYSAFSAPTS